MHDLDISIRKHLGVFESMAGLSDRMCAQRLLSIEKSVDYRCARSVADDVEARL
jgi:hypothetical protein